MLGFDTQGNARVRIFKAMRSELRAVTVKQVESGEKYILLGTGFGAFKATTPSLSFGNLAPPEESSHGAALAVCNGQGQMGGIHPDGFQVIEVDDKPPAESLQERAR